MRGQRDPALNLREAQKRQRPANGPKQTMRTTGLTPELSRAEGVGLNDELGRTAG